MVVHASQTIVGQARGRLDLAQVIDRLASTGASRLVMLGHQG
jgi:hypothetical protein